MTSNLAANGQLIAQAPVDDNRTRPARQVRCLVNSLGAALQHPPVQVHRQPAASRIEMTRRYSPRQRLITRYVWQSTMTPPAALTQRMNTPAHRSMGVRSCPPRPHHGGAKVPAHAQVGRRASRPTDASWVRHSKVSMGKVTEQRLICLAKKASAWPCSRHVLCLFGTSNKILCVWDSNGASVSTPFKKGMIRIRAHHVS